MAQALQGPANRAADLVGPETFQYHARKDDIHHFSINWSLLKIIPRCSIIELFGDVLSKVTLWLHVCDCGAGGSEVSHYRMPTGRI